MSGGEERLARAALTRLAEPGDELLNWLVNEHGAAAVLRLVRDHAAPPPGADRGSERRWAGWRARLPALEPERDLQACAGFGGRLAIPGDPEWPTQLDGLGDGRPYALWIRGRGDLRFSSLRAVSMVGSRAATAYGAHVAADMAASLADRGWAVISGGAYGIDGAAHRGVLAVGGVTVAVLACGLDVAYPRGHESLFREIASDGVVVSEWPPGSTPTRPRFLVRNRVIAALTRGTVIVEAAARSGALNTAGHAHRLERTLMAVPGPVTSVMSAGCHALLREWGAVCVTDAAEVLDLVGDLGGDLAPARSGPALARDALGPTTLRVLEALPGRGGAGPATLAVAAGVDLDTTLGCLGSLAAAGFIERCDEGWRLRRDRPK